MNSSPPSRGRFASAIRAALVVGLVWGAVDAALASRGFRFDAPLDVPLCVAGAVFVCTLLAAVPIALGAMVLRGRASRWLPAVGAAFALFIEAYWWSRPWVFSGYSATSPQRLAATAGIALGALALGAAFGALVARLSERASAWSAWTGVVVGAAGAIVVLGASGAPGGGRGALNDRNRAQANVLLIVVDALRADMLGCYGNTRVKTPHLDALAARGAVFERAYAQAPFTGASFGSIFTGKYPRRHGLVKMGPEVQMVANPTLPWHLKSARREQGGTMQDEDYATATFMTGALHVETGLMRGFDAWFEAMDGHDLVDGDSAWSRFRSVLVPFLIKNKLTQRFDPELVASEASRWIRALGDKRFCAMVHLYSTHTPYDPPQRFREQYCDAAYNGPIGAFYAYHREAIERGEYAATAADVAQIRHLYEAGVAHADEMVGQLVDALRASGVLEDTLVIVTSDHGENLGEPHALTGKPLWEHNHVNELNLRVPLVMSWPKGLPAGARVGALVESVDILPTVCDLFDLALPEALDLAEEYRAIDGHSLVPLVRGETTAVREYAYSENVLESSARSLQHRLVAARAALESKAADNDGSVAGAGPWMYDAEADPTSTHDLGAALPEQRARHWNALKAWSDALPYPLSKTVFSVRDYDQRALWDKLGYTGKSKQP
jgi:choline-sulfatase